MGGPLKPILALKSRKMKTQIFGGSFTISSRTFFAVSWFVFHSIQFDFLLRYFSCTKTTILTRLVNDQARKCIFEQTSRPDFIIEIP